VYGYWLGGKDHYLADREAAEEVIHRRPQVVAGARANRAFLARVVRYLAAECGIRQFLDIGTGLPSPSNTHDVAQAVAADCRIVYVDNDPLVLAHARALLTSTREGSCDYLDTDLRDTAAVLARGVLDAGFRSAHRRAAAGRAAFHPGHRRPGRDRRHLCAPANARQLPGHFTPDQRLRPAEVAAGVDAYNTLVPTALIPRSHSQVSALFAGLPLVPPGVVPLAEWRPAIAGPFPQTADLYAGVARVQGR
jgi:hypothetical protein